MGTGHWEAGNGHHHIAWLHLDKEVEVEADLDRYISPTNFPTRSRRLHTSPGNVHPNLGLVSIDRPLPNPLLCPTEWLKLSYNS